MGRKKMDRDIKGLKLCLQGMEMTSEKMRLPTIEFLFDKYIRHGKKKKKNG